MPPPAVYLFSKRITYVCVNCHLLIIFHEISIGSLFLFHGLHTSFEAELFVMSVWIKPTGCVFKHAIFYTPTAMFHPPMPYVMHGLQVVSIKLLALVTQEVNVCTTTFLPLGYFDGLKAVTMPPGNLCTEVIASRPFYQHAHLLGSRIGIPCLSNLEHKSRLF